MENKLKISLRYNLILISYFILNSFAIQVFEPETKEKVLWDFFFEASPKLSIITAILLYLVIVFWGAKLLQIFWNRFLSGVFEIRKILFQEALTMAIILSFVTL